MKHNIVHRFADPSKLDVAAFGTICRVSGSMDDKSFVYVQISHNEDEPNWNLVGQYKMHITDKMIVEDVSRILHNNS